MYKPTLQTRTLIKTNLLNALECPRYVNAEADERHEEEYASDEAPLEAVTVISVVEVPLRIRGTNLVQIIGRLGPGSAKEGLTIGMREYCIKKCIY